MIYFTEDEFACPCCGEASINLTFIQMLDEARAIAGVPFNINSGFRCEEHNTYVGGSPSSSHLKGVAVDLGALTSASRYKIISALLAVGFNRIGIADTFIHVDYDLDKSQNVIWTY